MRRKHAQPALPTLYFRDGVLSVPGYTFDRAALWDDTGSMTLLAEGTSLKDGSNVLAKIAPAHSNASMCLEREAHILERLSSSPESSIVALRLIDFFTVPKSNGDCVVLLLAHPGLNLLGRYFPPSKVNDLLLADVSRARPSSSHVDIYTMGMEPEVLEDMDPMDVMDLASFLEFAIQATHCLETMHRLGMIHREVRANAFHSNAHSGLVRLVHFGNRAVSLEQFGVPSAFVLRSDAFEETQKLKVKESLCYLAPEQTGSVEALPEDHRTDLYSLGIVFWTLLVGRGTMPFEGGPLELLHSVVQKRPMPVHEVRRDIPQVLALIIEKLLAKNPDARYQSAYGLKADLLQCQRQLLSAVTLATNESQELIPYFDIATQDRYMEFTIPSPLVRAYTVNAFPLPRRLSMHQFGRDKELEMIRNVIRHTSTNFSRHIGASRGSIVVDSSVSGTADNDARSESMSSSKSDASVQHGTASPTPSTVNMVAEDGSPKLNGSRDTSISSPVTLSTAASLAVSGSDGLRRAALGPTTRRPKTHAVVITGPQGAGKSSLVLANQAKWRSHGLWGQARFQDTGSAPFSSLLACLSSVLRQLIVFHTDLHRFVTALRSRLGPQLQNVPLLYEGAPELQDILYLFDIKVDMPVEVLETHELRARFQSLVEGVFAVLAETRLLALFLDDLHEANESSLDLINALINSRSRILIFMTVRSDRPELIDRLKSMCSNRSTTWINLDPLGISAVSSLVARTLHRSKDECSSLSRVIHAASQGNAFSARNILMTMHRQKHIMFNWDTNNWDFDLPAIEATILDNKVADPNNLLYLISHLRELPEDARKYIIWASFFGATFQITEVALMMDWEDSSSSSSDDDGHEYDVPKAVRDIRDNPLGTARGSMRGLQRAIQEGWLIQRGRDLCTFAHDRYRQAAHAEAENLPEGSIPKMSLRIILMMLHEGTPDVYRIAEHAQRCLSLLREHPKRDELVELLAAAGDSARTRGAHELALQSYANAYSLLDEDPWKANATRTMSLCLKLAELLTWKGDFDSADNYITDCLDRVVDVENKARILRLRSRLHWMRGSYSAALGDTIFGLHLLGVEINAHPSRREADTLFEQVKNEILAVGFDDILSIPRTRDARSDLAIALLNDASTSAYWSTGESFSDVIGLTTIQLALRAGLCSGTALGFFWALNVAAEKRELYRFSSDLGKLALRIADQYGTTLEKCRALVLYCAFVSGYDNVHVRSCLPRAEEGVKYGQSAGDRIYTCFATLHVIIIKLYICEHLSELVPAAEESVMDIAMWSNEGDIAVLAQGTLNCIRAIAGQTHALSSETAFDTDTFTEKEYLAHVMEKSGNIPVTMNWYNSFKVVGLFCLGYNEEAAELGFSVYATRSRHPNHRHTRYSLFFHSLAMIACVRRGELLESARNRYLKQIEVNQSYIRKWLSPSAVNTSTWVAIVDAEMASLANSPDAFKLYDVAVKLAVNNDWLLEEGWASYLQGCHFVRCGVEGLGGELQRRGIARHASWGARGIVDYLSSNLDTRSQYSLKRHIFSADAAVQTDNVVVTATSQAQDPYDRQKGFTGDEDQVTTLTASDLASILKWSKEISSDIKLALALQRLTEIATECSGSQNTCVVIARDAGDYTVATSMVPPETCQVHENVVPMRAISDPLQRAVLQQALNTKERIYLENVSSEPRFSSEAQQSPHKSVVCLPIVSNRNQTFGALYLASKYSFSPNTVTMLTLLCEQASIGVANALLFRSVQAGTRENLKMIAAQREALEAARKSREDALKATKIKSNFLASMSHELRTPFSSFYGLLDILSGTELNNGQREIVQTAKQSCELLLKIIDSILDYSKLEASALKLEYSGFAVESTIADCMELLLPMAAKKLDLAYNIEPDVPPWVKADYARIRQVLMNLIGNAVKFTQRGSVHVTCSVDKQTPCAREEVPLKFMIQDTGIGLSSSDIDLLFVPFQQADNSSTRRFGGTGLGLSISRQLVKLMGGAIGVQSELGVGSMFWFTIPVRAYDSDDSKIALKEIEDLCLQLSKSSPPRILIISESFPTSSLLRTMLGGFPTVSATSIEEAETYLRGSATQDPSALDFVILDSQSENGADELSRYLHSIPSDRYKDTKLIHLYTPTTDSLTGHTAFRSDTPGVIRLTKPPRKSRLLQTLLNAKNPSRRPSAGGEIARASSDDALAHRVLYGTVLIAEDNPVAQNLLIKQLERYDLKVVATSNGEEAIAEWESHDPGYFSVALFDHHMPICDGVEACKRIRVLENTRKANVILPIVALSADCQESTKQLCLSAGMNAFFTKPLKKGDQIFLLTTFGKSISPDNPDTEMPTS